MPFWNIVDLKLDEFRPGINSKAEIGDDLIMVCMEIGPGKEDAGQKKIFRCCQRDSFRCGRFTAY